VSARPLRPGDRVRIEAVVGVVAVPSGEESYVEVHVSDLTATRVLYLRPDACELVPPTFEPGDIVMAPLTLGAVERVTADGLVVLTTGFSSEAHYVRTLGPRPRVPRRGQGRPMSTAEERALQLVSQECGVDPTNPADRKWIEGTLRYRHAVLAYELQEIEAGFPRLAQRAVRLLARVSARFSRADR
jgi:hypothetical protein